MQYWIHKKDRLSKRKLISHKYKNGILRREMDDQQYRFPHSDNDKELKMNDLQPTVAGEYFCNGIQVAVLTVSLDTGDHITQVTTKKTGADSFVEVYETENKETDTERGEAGAKGIYHSVETNWKQKDQRNIRNDLIWIGRAAMRNVAS
nr:uncharacterized protein LOC111838954 isoform X4 [Paramormyrops kingsleyae]